MKRLSLPVLTRRAFLQRCSAALSLTGAGTAAYASGWERYQPKLVHSNLPCPRLRESQHGITVLHLSDLHVDDWTPPAVLENAVRIARDTQPDLIVLTGDFITSRPEAFLNAARVLNGLRAPLGQYACLGNHDRWHQFRRIADGLHRLGIQPLINESLRLQAPGGPLWITGLDSAWAGRPDPRSALRHWNPVEPNVILFHEPDAADGLANQQLAVVQLSGHTHGGQVRAPWLGAIETPHLGHKYVWGHHRIRDLHLYVNPGLGTMGVPFRFLCPPEITLHSLVAA